jgi:protein-S-isoprenylcysteine O-methyltransferase Ste14
MDRTEETGNGRQGRVHGAGPEPRPSAEPTAAPLASAPGRLVSAVGIGVRVVSLAAAGAGFFWIAGQWDWIRGWAFLGLTCGGHGLACWRLWQISPEMMIHRSRLHQGTKRWDMVWLGLFGVFYLGEVVVAALDAGRYGSSTMSGWLWPVGAALFLAQVVVLYQAMKVNPHFEKRVRIQVDRGHRVIDAGPYRVVRHPGYAALIGGWILATPLLLGSWWAFVPAVLAAVSLVVRTALEDRTLQAELTGYAAYAGRVRFRLIPRVW